MQVFQWTEYLETGLTDVDRQHRHLVDLTNAYGNLLAHGDVKDRDVEQLLTELVDYTVYHFEEEERLMAHKAVDARHMDQHKIEHQGFLQEVSLLQRTGTGAALQTNKHLFDFLLNWLIYHIMGPDMSLARQIAAIDAGQSPESAYQNEGKTTDRATALLLRALKNLFQQMTLRNKELVELNQSLEEKVTLRTRELTDANAYLEELASTDVLTGLMNRRRALEVLRHQWQKSAENNSALACLMIDADNFKPVNDKYGHDAGDQVLCALARELSYAVRTDDFVCRLGGDEFLVICPATNRAGALHLAAQLHGRIAALRIPVGDGAWQGSISVGAAVRTSTMASYEELIKAADRSVYAAKQDGRNCVRMVD
ncbi:MAG: GGDEF domain-containing protein [Pelovirga sp.]